MRPIGSLGVVLAGSTIAGAGGCAGTPSDPPREQAVLFVCEHGAAKSVIAAALFNARAAARKLPFRAESRGFVPDPALHPAAVTGLRRDGLVPAPDAPMRIRSDDLDRASVVVTFDPSPPDFASHVPLKMWHDVPAVSVDYVASRDDMLPRIDALLDELAGRDLAAGGRPP